MAKDTEINNIIMQEIGLEVGQGNKIYDQDTQEQLKLNGMDVVAQGHGKYKGCVEFDPYNNRKMAGQLFEYFLGKVADEIDEEVVAYYNVGKGSCGGTECRFSDNTKLRSSDYFRDSLRYADIMMQINGEESPREILSKFDIPYVKDTVKRRRTQNGTNSKTAKNSK